MLRLSLYLRACLSFFSGKDLLIIIIMNIVNYWIYSCNINDAFSWTGINHSTANSRKVEQKFK